MKIYTTNMVLLALATALLLGSCSRRSLEEEYADTALIPVSIDWSISGVPFAKMHRASVWLFPVNGAAPLEYRLESDLSYREIAVPVGVYSVLIFNETIEDNDWNGITFTGTKRYDTFAAMSIADAVRGFYVRSDGLPLILNPDPIAGWSLDRFEVTSAMVIRTRDIAGDRSSSYRVALEHEVPALTGVQPLPRFERVCITAYVTNLSSSMQTTGTLDGMSDGVYMASGELIPSAAAHAFILNGRVYDANGLDGTTTRTFNIFGRLPGSTIRHAMFLDFLLTDGTLHPREEYDVTGLIVTDAGSVVRTHFIHVGYKPDEGDHEIKLPGTELSAGISVDGWEEVVIPIM